MHVFKTALMKQRTINGEDYTLKGLHSFLTENDIGSQFKFSNDGDKEIEIDVDGSSLQHLLEIDFLIDKEYHELMDQEIDFILIM